MNTILEKRWDSHAKVGVTAMKSLFRNSRVCSLLDGCKPWHCVAVPIFRTCHKPLPGLHSSRGLQVHAARTCVRVGTGSSACVVCAQVSTCAVWMTATRMWSENILKTTSVGSCKLRHWCFETLCSHPHKSVLQRRVAHTHRSTFQGDALPDLCELHPKISTMPPPASHHNGWCWHRHQRIQISLKH